ncbi:MAG: hypothetical protein IJ815_03425, partial [Lachnospiraceae bacterium]|nr:hypothetical protein [Lachnospiraceae bacterium]
MTDKKKKINQVAVAYGTDSSNHLYGKYRKEFSYFLNPASAGTGSSGIGAFYIRDLETYDALRGILSIPMNSVSLLEGRRGIGKTSAISDAYGCGNNGIRIDEENGVVLVSIFYHRVIMERPEILSEQYNKITEDMIKSIFAVSRALEKKYPALSEWFFSEEGKDSFLAFIEKTNAKAPIDIDDPDETRASSLMKHAYLQERLIYAASKIKFYLSDNNSPIWRLLIAVDGIESLEEYEQEIAVKQFLRFFHCMGNFPEEPGRRVCTNLLLSMRPDTHQRMRNHGVLESDSAMMVIPMKQNVSLTDYFAQKLVVLPDDVRSDKELKWDDAYRILNHLCTKYEEKYAEMIMGLAGYDVREALHICDGILSSTWVTKDFFNGSGDDQRYVFNNISVIRAIACGDSLVYTGSDIIPNVLYNTEIADNVLLALYMISYFIPASSGARQRHALHENLIADLSRVFGRSKDKDFLSSLEETESYLEENGIIEDDEGLLTISIKGKQIWDMLS